ncbi:hypothetical protein HCG46_26175 [Labrenzia sp. PO1]|uniref:hypothetical protein n=1 Tax=Labrenzia sp. PO1 TaxID=2720390 RepID=UPI001445A31A|nr:hypothetical protein [Labrenzia sp. PO1]NKI61789.1 hypothetical protein [Labrenzia sp. PO1]
MDLKDQIEAAQHKVEMLRRKAERPGARIEDEFALERARNRLLVLELRVLKQVTSLQRKMLKGHKPQQVQQPRRMTAKERAEAAFADLQKEGA